VNTRVTKLRFDNGFWSSHGSVFASPSRDAETSFVRVITIFVRVITILPQQWRLSRPAKSIVCEETCPSDRKWRRGRPYELLRSL
jgi:hypothetical protein